MSVVFTGTNQGSFVSTGLPTIIQVRSGVDYIWVKNMTTLAAAAAGTGVEYYWQLGMTQGTGIEYIKTAVTSAIAPTVMAAPTGFYLINSSVNLPAASTALTGITANGGGYNSPQVLTTNTNGLPVTAVAGANIPVTNPNPNTGKSNFSLDSTTLGIMFTCIILIVLVILFVIYSKSKKTKVYTD